MNTSLAFWQNLHRVGLVGTERQPLPEVPADGPLGGLLAQLDPGSREQTLLGASGLLTLWRRAGQQPEPDGTPLLVPAEAEDLPLCSPQSRRHLSQLLEGEYAGLLPEWLGASAAAHRRVPPEFLPVLLEQGRKEPALRPYLLPALGKRGRWLAAQNPDWRYALQMSLLEMESAPSGEAAESGARPEEEVWQTGEREARLNLLHQLRATRPDRACELLAATWEQTQRMLKKQVHLED